MKLTPSLLIAELQKVIDLHGDIPLAIQVRDSYFTDLSDGSEFIIANDYREFQIDTDAEGESVVLITETNEEDRLRREGGKA